MIERDQQRKWKRKKRANETGRGGQALKERAKNEQIDRSRGKLRTDRNL